MKNQMAGSSYIPFLCHSLLSLTLPNDTILDWSKFKAFADDKINVREKLKICVGKGRKHYGKRRKLWFPAFSPFFAMFSNGFFLMVVKSRNCVVRAKEHRDREKKRRCPCNI